MMRKLVFATGLAAIGLSLIVPVASAHNERYVHDIAWGASPNPTTANDGAEVFNNDEVVAAVVHFADGVRSWDVVLRPVNGGQPSTCHEDLAQEDGKYPVDVYINCPWDTTRAIAHTLPGATRGIEARDPKFNRTWQSQDLGPSVNGKYTVDVNGMVMEVWILNPAELANKTWPRTPQETAAWLFDPATQTWTKR